MLYSTSRDFNQSLLDFFNLVDSQLILVLMCESLNLIFSGLYCWAFKLKVIINRTELNWNWEFALLQFQCVACMMCRCTVLLKTKLSSATCLITVKICWNSVVKNLTDSADDFRRQPKKTAITAPDIMADMVNADCVHIRWLDALCPVLVMFGAYCWLFYEWRTV